MKKLLRFKRLIMLGVFLPLGLLFAVPALSRDAGGDPGGTANRQEAESRRQQAEGMRSKARQAADTMEEAPAGSAETPVDPPLKDKEMVESLGAFRNLFGM